MITVKDYYGLLRLTPLAGDTDISAAVAARLATKPNPAEEAQIREAGAILLDTDKRDRYDRLILSPNVTILPPQTGYSQNRMLAILQRFKRPILIGLAVYGAAYGCNRFVIRPIITAPTEEAINNMEHKMPGGTVNNATDKLIKSFGPLIQQLTPSTPPQGVHKPIADDSEVYDRTTGTFVPRKKGVSPNAGPR